METGKVSSSAANTAPLVLYALPNQNPNLTADGSDDSSAAPKLISATAPKRFVKSNIPESILSNPAINAAIALLPSNYDFEVHKTVHNITSFGICLLDDLLMYALPIPDILQSVVDTRLDEVLIVADDGGVVRCVVLSSFLVGSEILRLVGRRRVRLSPQRHRGRFFTLPPQFSDFAGVDTYEALVGQAKQ